MKRDGEKKKRKSKTTRKRQKQSKHGSETDARHAGNDEDEPGCWRMGCIEVVREKELCIQRSFKPWKAACAYEAELQLTAAKLSAETVHLALLHVWQMLPDTSQYGG